MSKGIVIEFYKDGDEIEINNLFNTVFGRSRDLNAWKWKFKESPIDSRQFIALARDESKIIGQYSCIAYYLKYNNKTIGVLQPVDNFIHKDYRDGEAGIQVQFVSKLENIAREKGINIGFGFPNREAYIVGRKILKYKNLTKIENLFKRLSWRLWVKKKTNNLLTIYCIGCLSRFTIRLLLNAKSLKNVKYEWVENFDENIDIFWRKIKDQYGIMVKRDYAYLNWRYCKNQYDTYHILQAKRNVDIIGLIVVKYEDHKDVRIGFIMECLAIKEPYLLDNLIKKALLFLSHNKVDYVIGRIAATDPIKGAFTKQGFFPKDKIWDSKVVYKKYSSHIDEQIIEDPSMWHISFGDCDSA